MTIFQFNERDILLVQQQQHILDWCLRTFVEPIAIRLLYITRSILKGINSGA